MNDTIAYLNTLVDTLLYLSKELYHTDTKNKNATLSQIIAAYDALRNTLDTIADYIDIKTDTIH